MNIYAETNFVLELVFEQEEFSFCEKMLELCSFGKMHLFIPAYCLAEPHEKLIRQAGIRNELQQKLRSEMSQLERTASYRARIDSVADIFKILVDSNKEDKKRYLHYRERLLELAEIIPLTKEIINEASLNETQYLLSPQDAIVCSSVLTHLRQNQPQSALFLNRNSKDFKTPMIVDQLQQYNCKLITQFEDGYRYAQSIQF